MDKASYKSHHEASNDLQKIQELATASTKRARAAIDTLESPSWPSEGTASAFAFWTKFVSACEASLQLVRCGYAEEALPNLRTALENYFCAVALWKSPETYQKLRVADVIEGKKLSNTIIRNPKVLLSVENRLSLQSLHEKHQNSDLCKLSLKEIADIAQESDLYDSWYRVLSALGAHATGVSINHYISKNFKGEYIFNKSAAFFNGEIDPRMLVYAVIHALMQRGRPFFERSDP